mgnify:FL=1
MFPFRLKPPSDQLNPKAGTNVGAFDNTLLFQAR